jgi:hypothetical protein
MRRLRHRRAGERVLLVAVPVGDQLERALDLDSAVYGAYRVEVDVKARAQPLVALSLEVRLP